ncbi:MAG: dehydrogenase [Zetaproteobacteria bacterium]|nr:MAG: dehydrogenase [Zetaproteobacteria bacterium]
MRAAILTRIGAPLTIAEVELPGRLAAGQVLVRVHYSGICGSQIGEIHGVKGEDRYLPHLLGHEGSGEVVATGPGVRHVRPGAKVVLHWRKGAGIEADPPAYRWNGARLNAGWVTTFNEYAIVSENRLTPIPDGTDMKTAALFGCAVTTGFGVIEHDAELRIGESVVVFGAGGVGLNIVQAAALRSAWPIIAVDRYADRLALAARLGATHTIDNSKEDACAAIREIAGAKGVDLFVDNTGQPAVIEAGYRLTQPRGRVVLVGVPKQGEEIHIHSLPLHFGKRITGSHGGGAQPELDIPRYMRLVRARGLRLEELITQVVPLEEINQAITDLQRGAIAGRCLIEMER